MKVQTVDLRATCCRLPLLLALVAVLTAALVLCSSINPANKGEELLMELDEDVGMTPEQLSDMMEEFGREIGGLMSENINKMLSEDSSSNKNKRSKQQQQQQQQQGKNNGDLQKIKQVNELVAKDAETRIAAAGRAGTGELAEFSLSDAYASGKDFFVNKVNVRLQQAGSFIGSQMSSLANMAPKLKEKLRNAPDALKKILSWPTFFNFKIKFNKVYKNRLAELYHQMNFLKTQTITGIHNMKFFFGKSRHLQKTTQYADLTEEEYNEQTGNDAELADKLDDDKQEGLRPEQLAKLRELKSKQRNIYGGDMQELLTVSKETSPAEMLRAKRAPKHLRRKRDSSELDDDDEEGPTYSFSAFESPEDDSSGARDELDEEEDLGGNHEAELVDDFANGFQHIDLEAQMDAELEGFDDDDDDENKIDDGHEEEQEFTPIDWSQHRCMPKIENQDNCGFCYALVASTMTDFYICMWNLKDNPDARPRRLSGRFVSDCGRYLYKEGKEVQIDGCSGGIIGQAVKFIREAGTMTFFGYENHRVAAHANFDEDTCVLPRPPTLKDWAPIRADYLQNVSLVGVEREDWATVNLFLHAAGPVILNLRPWPGFKNYAGGIFDELQVLPEGGKVHSVMIVGRDRDEQGRIYYKLRNTHGIPWGERGYFRVSAEALKHYSTIKGILMPE